MKTKELIEGLRAMYEWHDDFRFSPELFYKFNNNPHCVEDAKTLIDEIIKRLEEHDELKEELYRRGIEKDLDI